MLSRYYHFDPCCVWPAGKLLDELRSCGVRAKRNGANLEVQVEIDQLMPAPRRFWHRFRHLCLNQWDILISFNKNRFLRNVEVEVDREFCPEYEVYLAQSVGASMAKVGCVELWTADDEFSVARSVAGSNPKIASAIDAVRNSMAAACRHRKKLNVCDWSDLHRVSQILKQKSDAYSQVDSSRTRLDEMLFDHTRSKC